MWAGPLPSGVMQHTSSCGAFVIDPFDIEVDCCLDVAEPVRPHQIVESNVTVINHEQVAVEGDLNYTLADAKSGEVISELGGEDHPFSLESGETAGYELQFTPEEYGVPHTVVNEFDDDIVASVEVAVENVRAPEEHDDRGVDHSE